MKIGITGATGQLGSIVVNKLKENAKNDIVALVRTPSKIENSDIEVRAFDYSKIEGQIEALNGIDVLLLISSSEVGQREEERGVRVIRTASLGSACADDDDSVHNPGLWAFSASGGASADHFARGGGDSDVSAGLQVRRYERCR